MAVTATLAPPHHAAAAASSRHQPRALYSLHSIHGSSPSSRLSPAAALSRPAHSPPAHPLALAPALLGRARARHMVAARSSVSSLPGPDGALGEQLAEVGGQGRGFRRRTKGLLNKKSGELPHSGGGGGGEQSPTAVSAAAAAVAVQEVEEEAEEEEGYGGSSIGSAGPLCTASPSNNLGRNRALVLDCAYRPINVISWAKAVMMDWTQKGEVVEYYPPPAIAYSGQGLHSLPAVIRVPSRYIDLNEVVAEVSCTRRNVLTRDKFTCQYCGCSGKEGLLTLDHILPVSKGGRNSWLNLVTACMSCNQKKGDKLLQQMGWRLRSVPKRPSPWELGLVVGLNPGDVERPCPEWEPYVQPYRQKMQDIRRRAHEAGLGGAVEEEA